MRDISRKCSLVNTPTAGTPLVFRAMLKHEKNYMMPMGPQAYRMKKGKGIFIRKVTCRSRSDQISFGPMLMER